MTKEDLDTIQRCPHDKQNPFAQISRTLIRNKRISPGCRWLIIYLLSMKDGWKITVKQVIQHVKGQMGRDKVRTLFNEACNAGYMRKERVFGGFNYFISETPKFKKCLQSPENQGPDFQCPENQSVLRKNISSSKEEEKKKKHINKGIAREGASPKSATPPAPPDSHYVGRFENKIVITTEQRSRLVEKYGGMESLVDQYAEKLHNYSLTKPKKFKEYARHDKVIEKWIDEDLAKPKEETKPKPQKQLPFTDKLNPVQLENFQKNHDLVEELIKDDKRVFGGLEFYFKAHVLRDKNSPNFSVSGLIDHRDFCRVLDKHFDGTIEKAVFGNVEFS